MNDLYNRDEPMEPFYNNWQIVLFGCLTLGLAPFAPPHIWGKVLWVLGGANGMKPLDWFDFFWHGAPWFLLIRLILLKLKKLVFK